MDRVHPGALRDAVRAPRRRRADDRRAAHVPESGNCGRESLVWTGEEYALAFSDIRDGFADVYFLRFAADGTRLDAMDTRITETPGWTYGASLVWTGARYALAFSDERGPGPVDSEIYLSRIGSTGIEIGPEQQVTAAPAFSSSPSLVWDGASFAMAWSDQRDGNAEIYFVRLDATGKKQTDE